MQRSRIRTVCGVHAQAALVAATLFWLPSAMANGPLDTIFSAENALYGAGYDIGRADGWIDDRLRSAVRNYQADTDGLTVSGNLDQQTLKALGIRSDSDRVISRNAVASRGQALAALNLQEPPASRPAEKPVAVAKSAPSSQAETDVVTRATAEPSQEPIENPAEKRQTVVIAKVSQPESEPTDVAVIKPEGNKSGEEKQQDSEITSNLHEEEATRNATVEAMAAAAPAPIEPQTVSAPEPAPGENATGDDIELAARLPAEPTAAGPAEPQVVPDLPRSRSSGGFFSSLFDFLFGWLA